MYKIVDTYKIFDNAMKENDYSYDIYFRMAVIKKYLEGNKEIWELYDKMQKIRCGQIKQIPLEMLNHKKSFIQLINSFKLSGYNHKFPIMINKDGLIIDGAHRMACSLFFDIPLISINADQLDFVPADYSKKWFIQNDLTDCIVLADIERDKVRSKIKCLNQKKY